MHYIGDLHDQHLSNAYMWAVRSSNLSVIVQVVAEIADQVANGADQQGNAAHRQMHVGLDGILTAQPAARSSGHTNAMSSSGHQVAPFLCCPSPRLAGSNEQLAHCGSNLTLADPDFFCHTRT